MLRISIGFVDWCAYHGTRDFGNRNKTQCRSWAVGTVFPLFSGSWLTDWVILSTQSLSVGVDPGLLLWMAFFCFGLFFAFGLMVF